MKFYKCCNKLNSNLEKIMPILTPTALVCGFLFPDFLRIFSPYITVIFALMTLPGALKLKISDLGKVLRHPLPLIIFIGINHLLVPLFTYSIAHIVFLGNLTLITGFVILYATPTAVSSTMWAEIYDADMALTLSIIIIDVILTPFLTPTTISILSGTKVHLDIKGMFISLMIMIVIPSILGIILNEASKGKIPKVISPILSPISKVLIFFIVGSNTAVASSHINLKSPKTYEVAILCFVLAVSMYFIGMLIAKITGLKEGKRASIILGCGMRNISIGATIAIHFFPPAVALPCLVGPMFQQTLAATVGKFILKKKDKTN
ncbi:MAG: bile acid:sodium symporter family protein [Lachnospiraceae bacterium]|jgi:predicted Na+-dependent transporter|nr:bile acid:sodium symporter family protein [Lachnospiraceae bacterium]